MKPPVSPATRLVALLGDPVAHSLSPAIQNAAFQAAGVDGVYLALGCDGTTFPELLRGISRAGGAGNVTVPHKRLAADTVERRTEAVERTGACNTFWSDGGVIHGDNTDVAGFAHAVHRLLGRSVAGARVLLLGAGGAARAALYSMLDASADEVLVLNRSADRAAALVAAFDEGRTHLAVAASASDLGSVDFDLVVNATSLGLHDRDPLPLDPDLPISVAAVLDLVYSPQGTAWVREHLARGIPAADGLEMLLYQGAAAFERWWGAEAPIEAMRAALPQR